MIDTEQYSVEVNKDKEKHYVCIFCKEVKISDDFTEYQQQKQQKRCIGCTGTQQVNKVVCGSCNKRLRIDKFSKIQRRRGDKVARCKKCVDADKEIDVIDSLSESD